MQPTVLVIDDTISSATLVRHALTPEFRVLSALTGEDGLAIAEKERPDVVLLDVMLPHMDGFAVCRELRESRSLFGVPVVMISSLEDRATRLAGFDAGADDFVSKPIDRLELTLRMRSIVRLNRFRKLLTAREQFELVFLSSPDPQLLIDRASSDILLANVAADELALCERWLETVESSDRAKFERAILDLDRGHPTTVTARIAGRDGELQTAECRLAATEWEGRPAVIVTVRDISDRVRAEARRQQDARVQAALAATAGMAHDFGNYLMAIQGGIELAERLLTAEHPARALLASAGTSAAQAAGLVGRATALAKGVSTMRLRPVNLAAFVREIEPSIRSMLGPVTLELSLDERVPEAIADAGHLERIVMNLVANARAAIAAAGTVAIDLTDETRPDGVVDVRLAIRDTGCGMSADVQQRAFEPYFTTRGESGGTGLGLATVQRLMELQGGSVSMVSAVGAGTVFTLTLPSARADRHFDTLVPGAKEHAISLRVIIADDQGLIRAGIRAILSGDASVEVVAEAADGIDVVKKVKELTPDVVLMDINMPLLNGFEATARLAEEAPRTKVIVLSQYEDEVTARRAVKAGAKGYVLKGAAVEELFSAIRAVVRGQSYFVSPVGDYVANWAAGGQVEVDPVAALSLRQRAVLQLIAEGLSTKEIAFRLNLSNSTVDTHRTELMRRLDLHDVASLVRFAIQHGLTRVDPPVK